MQPASPVLRPPSPRLTRANLRRWSGIVAVLAVRGFRLRYLRLRLALLWPLVQPVTQALVLSLVFVHVFGVRGIEHYPLFVLTGVVVWQLFSQSVMGAMSAAVGNAGLVKKVPVPTALFALAEVGTCVLVLAPQLVLLTAVAVALGTVGVEVLLLPLATLIVVLLAIGTGLLFGAYLPQLRELQIGVEALLVIGLYATPVLYDPTALPESVRGVVRLNPMDGALQLFRGALLDRPVDSAAVAVSLTAALALAALGTVVYNRRARVFADLV